MLKNILNLEGVELLSKTQQKSINGGKYASIEAGPSDGGCCATVVGSRGTERSCGMTKKEAQDAASYINSFEGVSGFWCCASC